MDAAHLGPVDRQGVLHFAGGARAADIARLAQETWRVRQVAERVRRPADRLLFDTGLFVGTHDRLVAADHRAAADSDSGSFETARAQRRGSDADSRGRTVLRRADAARRSEPAGTAAFSAAARPSPAAAR